MKAADNKVRQQCIGKQRICRFAIANLVLACAATHLCQAKHSDLGMQHVIHGPVQIATESSTTPGQFVLYGKGQVPSLYVAPEDLYVVRLVTNAFADDVNRVTGKRPKILGDT